MVAPTDQNQCQGQRGQYGYRKLGPSHGPNPGSKARGNEALCVCRNISRSDGPTLGTKLWITRKHSVPENRPLALTKARAEARKKRSVGNDQKDWPSRRNEGQRGVMPFQQNRPIARTLTTGKIDAQRSRTSSRPRGPKPTKTRGGLPVN